MRLSNLIESFVIELTDYNSKQSSDKTSLALRQIGRQGFYFNREMEDHFSEIIEEIAKYQNLGLKLSNSFIEKEFINSLERILSDTESLKIGMEDLLKRLISLTFSSRVFLPISGLKSEMETFKLGPYQFLQNPPSYLSSEILSFLDQIKPKDVTGKPIEQKRFVELVSGNIPGKLTLVVDIDVEPDKAVEIATREGQTIVSILKLYLNPRHLVRNLSKLYLGGQPLNHVDSVLVFDTLNTGVRHQSRLVGAIEEIVLTQEIIDDFKRHGIDKLLQIIRTRTKNDFNDKLLRSILWYTEGCFKERQSDQILSLVVALECVMKPRSTMAIKDSIVENVAVLIGNDLVERKQIIKELKELIDLRNGVAHGSGTMDISDAKMTKFNNLVERLIFRLIDFIGKVKSMEEVHVELTNERLTPY